MSSKKAAITIHPDTLVVRLAQVEIAANGDPARVIELLLLQNHVLRGQRSVGLNRGVEFEFSDFPRFLKIEDPETESDVESAQE